jgi:DNA-binding CsgD family transcriptional regulator
VSPGYVTNGSDPLSRRQKELIQSLADGKSLEDTCKDMYIAYSTGRATIYDAQEKTGTTNRLQLVAFCCQNGWVEVHISHPGAS